MCRMHAGEWGLGGLAAEDPNRVIVPAIIRHHPVVVIVAVDLALNAGGVTVNVLILVIVVPGIAVLVAVPVHHLPRVVLAIVL